MEWSYSISSFCKNWMLQDGRSYLYVLYSGPKSQVLTAQYPGHLRHPSIVWAIYAIVYSDLAA